MKKLLSVVVSIVCALAIFSCTKDSVSDIKVTDARVVAGTMTVSIGTVTKVEVQVTPAEAAGTLEWKSSNNAVVSVSSGYIQALGPGTAQITVSAPNGKSASFNVLVTQLEITEWSFSPSTLEIAPGFSNYVEATIKNGEGMNDDNKGLYTAASLNFSIEGAGADKFTCSVSGNTVTVACSSDAASDGSCTASLVSRNMSGTKSVSVALKAIYRPVESVSLNMTTVAELFTSSSVDLQATISPSNATAKDIEWIADNDCVKLEVDGAKCKVTGAKAGTAKVTAKATSNGKYATCAINVVEPYVKSINVDMSNTVMCVGATSEQTKLVKVTIEPAMFPYAIENLTPDIIDLNDYLISNPKKAGVAKIKVTAGDYSTTKSFLVVEKKYSLNVFSNNYRNDESNAPVDETGFYGAVGADFNCLPGGAVYVYFGVDSHAIDKDSWWEIAKAYSDANSVLGSFFTAPSVSGNSEFLGWDTTSKGVVYCYFKAPNTLNASSSAKFTLKDGNTRTVSMSTGLTSATAVIKTSSGFDPYTEFATPTATAQNGGSITVARPTSGGKYVHIAVNPGTSYDINTSMYTGFSSGSRLTMTCDNSSLAHPSYGSYTKSFYINSSTPKATYKIYCAEFPSFYINLVVN